jgi:hypothetical protein
MKSTSTKAAVLILLLAFCSLVEGGPSPNWGGIAFGLNVGSQSGGYPVGTIVYRAGWSASGANGHHGIHVHYCVAPFIKITGRPNTNSAGEIKPQAPWTLPFELSLVDAAGTRKFRPMTAPIPIPANTTRELLPAPPWCAEVAGVTRPPEIYLQVGTRRARVIFDSPLPNTSPR